MQKFVSTRWRAHNPGFGVEEGYVNEENAGEIVRWS